MNERAESKEKEDARNRRIYGIDVVKKLDYAEGIYFAWLEQSRIRCNGYTEPETLR